MRVNGTEKYHRSFKIYAPATMPASAMSKVDYFWVARARIDAKPGEDCLKADLSLLIVPSGIGSLPGGRRSGRNRRHFNDRGGFLVVSGLVQMAGR